MPMVPDDDADAPELDLGALFLEPARPPSPPLSVSTYNRGQQRTGTDVSCGDSEWSQIKINLVGSHPLWGHYLWNAARAFASYLDMHPHLYRDKNVLELGAGGGLPGLVAALNGARKVVLTDYPDKALLDNLASNVRENISPCLLPNVAVEGYVWGKSVRPLLELTDEAAKSSVEISQAEHEPAFDLIILSDLIFNHSQHDALLKSCELTLRSSSGPSTPPPQVLVFFSHHRPRLAHRDMAFFTTATARGWVCEEVLTEVFPPMFPDDPGDEAVRATVHGWKLSRPSAPSPLPSLC